MAEKEKGKNKLVGFLHGRQYAGEESYRTLEYRRESAWRTFTGVRRAGVVPIVQALPFLEKTSVAKEGKAEPWSKDGGVLWLEKLRFFYLHQINFPGRDEFIDQIERGFFKLLYHDVNPSYDIYAAGKANFFGEGVMEAFVRMAIAEGGAWEPDYGPVEFLKREVRHHPFLVNHNRRLFATPTGQRQDNERLIGNWTKEERQGLLLTLVHGELIGRISLYFTHQAELDPLIKKALFQNMNPGANIWPSTIREYKVETVRGKVILYDEDLDIPMKRQAREIADTIKADFIDSLYDEETELSLIDLPGILQKMTRADMNAAITLQNEGLIGQIADPLRIAYFARDPEFRKLFKNIWKDATKRCKENPVTGCMLILPGFIPMIQAKGLKEGRLKDAVKYGKQGKRIDNQGQSPPMITEWYSALSATPTDSFNTAYFRNIADLNEEYKRIYPGFEGFAGIAHLPPWIMTGVLYSCADVGGEKFATEISPMVTDAIKKTKNPFVGYLALAGIDLTLDHAKRLFTAESRRTKEEEEIIGRLQEAKLLIAKTLLESNLPQLENGQQGWIDLATQPQLIVDLINTIRMFAIIFSDDEALWFKQRLRILAPSGGASTPIISPSGLSGGTIYFPKIHPWALHFLKETTAALKNKPGITGVMNGLIANYSKTVVTMTIEQIDGIGPSRGRILENFDHVHQFVKDMLIVGNKEDHLIIAQTILSQLRSSIRTANEVIADDDMTPEDRKKLKMCMNIHELADEVLKGKSSHQVYTDIEQTAREFMVKYSELSKIFRRPQPMVTNGS